MKKGKLLIAVILTCSFLSGISFACAAQISETPDVDLQYTGITSLNTPFIISDTGLATCDGICSIKDGYYVTAGFEITLEKPIFMGISQPLRANLTPV